MVLVILVDQVNLDGAQSSDEMLSNLIHKANNLNKRENILAYLLSFCLTYSSLSTVVAV